MRDKSLKVVRFLYFTSIIGILSGCSMTGDNEQVMRGPNELLSEKTEMMQLAAKQANYQTSQPAFGHYTVEIQNAYGVKQRAKFKLRQGMFIQDALRESKVLDQFNFMTIKLRRPTNDPMRFLPLDIEFNPEFRRIEPINDYAIHDGDYIIVRQQATGELHEMLGNLKSRTGF
jgi:hypothetical protein